MSHVLLPLIDCPKLQGTLNEITDKGENPYEPAPELMFLTSPTNTNGRLEQSVVQSNGKIRQLELTYTPRVQDHEVDTTLTTDCTSTNNAGESSTTYDIDELVGAQYDENIVVADLTRRCQANPAWFAQRVLAILDGVERKMQTKVAEQMAALYGKFASDGGETGLSAANTLKTVETKYPVATHGGKWNPEALQEIVYSAMNSGFTGIPYVFGYGEIWRYWNYLIGLGNSSDGGLDFAKYVGQNQAAFMPSLRMHTALNPSGGNKFLAIDAASLFLLQYNRFDDPLIKVNDGMTQMDIIVNPKSGIRYNYKISRTCDEKFNIFISTSFKVVGLPDDMYSGGDRLEGTKGVLRFDISNT